MKKLTLLLAVAVVLSCCLLALASCGDQDDTSSEASSSLTASSEAASSAAASSEAASSEAAASEETSVEETSSEETSSEEASLDPNAKPNEDGSNLALGKTYTRSLLYRQGSGDVGWGWDDNAEITYPDEDDATLTDGLFPADDATYTDPAWMGFSINCPDYADGGYSWLTVDLGDSYELSRLVLYVGGQQLGAGISAPASVEFLVSADGENFTSVGTAVPADGADVTNAIAELTCNATGRYVQIRIIGAGAWMFVSEFEAY